MSTEHELNVKNTAAPEAVEHTRECPVVAPDADIAETKDALILVMDMPGVSEKSIRVELEDRVLTVTAEPGEDPEPAMPVARREFCARGYRRAFRIYADVQTDGIQARLRHGVLKLTLPKAAPVQPRQIRVETDA
ncbi:MAG: Hsp20/alpha crystallin family protein [Kiritimatiellae bacterium]|nr:Hsp20/alpha crystallin family protein [Kiritimatiellia bacterium]